MTRSTVAATVAALAFVTATGPPPASGQAPASTPREESMRIDVSTLGPQVGETVPGFTLPDQHGRTWDLPSIMGPNGAMLVFFRSADW